MAEYRRKKELEELKQREEDAKKEVRGKTPEIDHKKM